MTTFLLAIHVVAAIITVGPVTVAASMFPPAARRALADPSESRVAIVRLLHRICRIYAAVGIAVPVFGLATANSLGVLGDTWLIISIILTAAAGAMLALLVLPRQGSVLRELDRARTNSAPSLSTTTERAVTARMAMHTGIFNLLWAVVTILMIARPGSTTGA